eukprot:CAMPEP_0119015028 /NCGR_PEP_ID=MMETSP1176-20130426/10519_1 /TAXON_ID=265551 /ORGANISM="Synedropsis recta cf, Strain CCMP1620" /LENGTH=184 /DNA_ID=CAMNT_0006968287 /DNA_START=73 /DNA_END=627 /DNA_ORIENTATION=+
MTSSLPSTLPSFPLMCLTTAQETTTIEAFRGKNVVIDLWTTKCTRCPAALDKLNAMAEDPKYGNVTFASICCDKLDGAREILEQDDDLRWQNISHYFMEQVDKEEAKKVLGFKSVPFYVFCDESGTMTQTGSTKTINFDDIPGALLPEEDKENMIGNFQPTAVEVKSVPVPFEQRVFEIDDLDF